MNFKRVLTEDEYILSTKNKYTTISVGGLEKGTDVKDMTVRDALNEVLFPYVAPTFNNMELTISESTLYNNESTITLLKNGTMNVPLIKYGVNELPYPQFKLGDLTVKINSGSEKLSRIILRITTGTQTPIEFSLGDITFANDVYTITSHIGTGYPAPVSFDSNNKIYFDIDVIDAKNTTKFDKRLIINAYYPYFYSSFTNTELNNMVFSQSDTNTTRWMTGTSAYTKGKTFEIPKSDTPKRSTVAIQSTAYNSDTIKIKDPNNFTQTWNRIANINYSTGYNYNIYAISDPSITTNDTIYTFA